MERDQVMNQSEHEESLIKAFIVPQKRDRWLSLIGSPKRRRTFLEALYHFRDLDERFAARVPVGSDTPSGIANALCDLGAGATCWAISTDEELDGREVPLDAALAAIHGLGEGTFLSCVPGQLAYFEGEDAKDRWILRRKAR
jgi:hypothetical protein